MEYSLQNHMKESSKITKREALIMLKITELLMRDQLISPEERFHLTEIIRKDEAV